MLSLFVLAFADYCVGVDKLCIQMVTDSTGVNVTVSLKVSNSIGWAAVGVGKTMSNSDMVVAWKNGKQVVISPRYSLGEDMPVAFKSKYFYNPQFAFKDDYWLLSFTRPLNPTNDGFKNTIAKGQNTFIYAYSAKPVNSADPAADFDIHSAKGSFDFNVLTGGVSVNLLETLHGYGLIILWTILTPISVILARYYKHIGHKWFIAHAGIQFITVTATVILGLLMESKYGWGFKTVHEIIGTIMIVIGTLQVCGGFYIHFSYDPSRSRIPSRDKAHGIIGFLIWFMSIYQMVSGLSDDETKLRLYIFAPIVALMFFAMIGLQLKRMKATKNQRLSK